MWNHKSFNRYSFKTNLNLNKQVTLEIFYSLIQNYNQCSFVNPVLILVVQELLSCHWMSIDNYGESFWVVDGIHRSCVRRNDINESPKWPLLATAVVIDARVYCFVHLRSFVVIEVATFRYYGATSIYICLFSSCFWCDFMFLRPYRIIIIMNTSICKIVIFS